MEAERPREESRLEQAPERAAALPLLAPVQKAYSEVVAEQRRALEEAREEYWVLCPQRWQWALAAVRV